MKKIITDILLRTIPQAKMAELWKIKLMVYASRDVIWIKQRAYAPLIFTAIAVLQSGFNSSVMLLSFSVSLVLIFISIACYKKISFLHTKGAGAESKYSLIALLNYAFDLSALFGVVFSAFLIATIEAPAIPMNAVVARLMIGLLLLTVAVSCLSSPKITASKSMIKTEDKTVNSHLAKIISVSSVIPSFFLFLVALMNSSGTDSFVPALITFGGYLSGILLVPYVVAGFFELILLSLSEWPVVK
jgi:hypothetical protein